MVHAEVTFPDGFITQRQQDVKDLFTGDAKAIQIDLRLGRVVRVPVYAVSLHRFLGYPLIKVAMPQRGAQNIGLSQVIFRPTSAYE